MGWLKISCMLCVFGFLRELRPSDPYITDFFLGPWRNITEEQLNREIYPMGTYSYLAQLVIVFLITDFLLYKPLIITNGITGIIVWSMLLWTTSLESFMAINLFYGTYMAADVAYCTYMYAKVDKKHYPKVTSHARAATFAAKLIACISSQLLISFNIMDYRQLLFISLGAQILATIWAFFLPKVDRSIYFHAKNESIEITPPTAITENSNESNNCNKQFVVTPTKLLWTHFCNAYTNIKVIQWSLWYAVDLCGFLQVTVYIQLLWKNIEPTPDISWNAAVEAISTTLATLFALGAGYIHAGRLKSRANLLLLVAFSVLQGLTRGYTIFGALYGFTITVAGSEVARFLEEDSYALVFGINTTIALIFQTIFTLVVISDSGFALTVKEQFTVYGFYFIVFGIFYFVFIVFEFLISKLSKRSYNL